MVRRLVLFVLLAIVCALILPAGAAAVDHTVTVEIPLNRTASDLHIVYYYLNAGGNPVAMPTSNPEAKVWNGSAWVSAGTAVSSGTTITVDSGGTAWPSPGRVGVRATVSKPAWNTEVKIWYQWTYAGVPVAGDYAYGESDLGASAGYMLDAWVQRSIKLTVTGSDYIDFGRIRFGESYSAASQFKVESNDHYYVYLSSEFDEASRGDMRTFLEVSVENPETSTAVSSGIGGLAGGPPEHTLDVFAFGTEGESSPDPDWWVESFFDVFFEVHPTPGVRPGFYRAYVDAYAVQTY